MALQDVVIPVDFGQGIDTKTDPKLVVGGKFLSLQNGIFTNAKRVTKRNGYDALTTATVGGGVMSNPVMIRSYKNEMVIAATNSLSNGSRLLAYSPTLNAWADRGQYVSVANQKVNITGLNINHDFSYPIGGTQNGSSDIAGNIQLYAYQVFTSTGVSQVYWGALDVQTGSHLVQDTPVANAVSNPKIVVLGSSQLAIFYNNSSTNLAVRLLNISGTSISLSSENILSIDAGSGSVFDVTNASYGGVLVFWDSPSIRVRTIDASANTINQTVISASGVLIVNTSLDQSGNVYVFYSNLTNTYWSVFNSTLSSSSTGSLSSAAASYQMASIIYDSSHQLLFFSVLQTLDAEKTSTIYSAIIKNDGTTTGQVFFAQNVDIYAKPINILGQIYLPTMFYSQFQPTGFIFSYHTGQPVAKFLPGEAEGLTTYGPAFIGARQQGYLASTILESSTSFQIMCGWAAPGSTVLYTNTTTTLGYTSYPIGVVLSLASITFDFANQDAYQGIVENNTLVLNGSIPIQYDGNSCSEINFNVFPDGIAVVPSTGTTFSAGTYQVYVVYCWTDANGNFHQSAPSAPYQVILSGSKNLTLLVKTLGVTQKNPSSVLIQAYITQPNGTVAYLSGVAINGIANPTTSITLSAYSFSAEPIYTTGSIVDNGPPPPSMILWANNNRLWCVDSENPSTNIYYSKTSAPGYGIAFGGAGSGLNYVIDSRGGAIAGVSPMDEKTVVLKQNAIGYFIGDGNNDTGTGSNLTPFQFVPTDTGCTNSKSVVLYPSGVLFRSPKGIYLINRGVQVTYFGLPVEKYNSQDIQSAFIVPNKNQIRFLTSSGLSLLYDYVFNQWSTFTNHTGLSADSYNGVYTYVTAGGLIYIENSSSFLDNGSAIAFSAQTGWLVLSSVQNFERIRWGLMLGDYQNGSSAAHGLQIQAAYDFGANTANAVSYTFDGPSGSGVFQYRNFFSQQKCDSISLTLTEITTGASGEYVDLTDMTLVAALKRGSTKVSAAKSVG